MGDLPLREMLASLGPRPAEGAAQDASRNYSERFSAGFAGIAREEAIRAFPDDDVMTPEAIIPTVFGTKRLDVGIRDTRGYLVADLSIKTFNFKDRRTCNYRHNFTGRFYEFLGEELDVRRSYPHVVLAGLVLLPDDAADDTTPSSFAHAVRQFSKVLHLGGGPFTARFEHMFIGLHSTRGELAFHDATRAPPAAGLPAPSELLSLPEVLAAVRGSVDARRAAVSSAPLPVYRRYRFSGDRERPGPES